MAPRQKLSNRRYQEILEKVVYEGHYPTSKDEDRDQIKTAVQLYGGPANEDGIYSQNSRGVLIPPAAQLWEVEQFIVRAGDLQHELGPPGLTHHLKTLDLRASDVDLKQFFARTMYCTYPEWPRYYHIPVRSLNGQLYHLIFQLGITEWFGADRDLDREDALKSCGRSRTYPADFFVTSKVVTCLRPRDANVDPSLMIGLGRLLDSERSSMPFILVWFLDKAKLGVVYDYTETVFGNSDIEFEEHDLEHHTNTYKASFPGVGFEFSLATLDGDFQLGDGKDPEKEWKTQLEGDITLYLNPFVYTGFKIEDACRTEGVIRPFSKELLWRARNGAN